jgi:hypothetical protein
VPNQFFGCVKAIDHDGLIMVLLGSKRADGGAQIRKVIDQTEAVDLQAAGTAVFGLQEDWRGKFAGNRRLADTFRTVDQDPRPQLCGGLANIGEVHLTSSLSFLAEDEIERDAERTARCAIGIATESASDNLGISAVLKGERAHNGAVTRGSVGVAVAPVVGQKISARRPSGNRPMVQVYRSPPACRSKVSAGRRLGRRMRVMVCP